MATLPTSSSDCIIFFTLDVRGALFLNTLPFTSSDMVWWAALPGPLLGRRCSAVLPMHHRKSPDQARAKERAQFSLGGRRVT